MAAASRGRCQRGSTPDATGWDPWADARDRHDLLVVLDPVAGLMGGGFRVRRGGTTVVVVDPRLPARRATAVLAHELVHDERGAIDVAGGPRWWQAVVDREERAVEREVARRLAPTSLVRRAVDELLAAEGAVTIDAVAEALDLDAGVAAIALEQLAGDA